MIGMAPSPMPVTGMKSRLSRPKKMPMAEMAISPPYCPSSRLNATSMTEKKMLIRKGDTPTAQVSASTRQRGLNRSGESRSAPRRRA